MIWNSTDVELCIFVNGEILSYAVVTVWYKMNKATRKYHFNHISPTYSDNEYIPEPKNELQQKAWFNQAWKKYRGVLIKGKLMIVNEVGIPIYEC